MPLENSNTQGSKGNNSQYQRAVITLLQQVVAASGGGGGGSATAGNQVTGNNSLSSIDGKLTGVSTAANQTTGNNSLSSIDGKTPTVGQKTMAASSPVVLASDQSSIPVTISGVATAANQATEITSLSTIATNALISTNNSSVVTLAISGVFTGASDDITQYGYVNISVFSDVASAVDGLSIQQSNDGTNWNFLDTYTVPAATGKVFSVPRNARFFRIVYTNGGTIQAVFRLQVIYTKGNVKPSSVRPQEGRSNDNDMEEVLSYAMSYDPILNVWNRVQTQDLVITGQGTQTAVGQNIVLATAGTGSTDCIGYRSIGIQIISTGTISSGTVIFEGSNDNVTFFGVMLYDDNTATSLPQSTVTPTSASSKYFSGPIHFRYFRTRISVIIAGGGSIQAVTILRQTTFTPVVNMIATAAVTSLVPGVTPTSLGKAEDAASVSGDTGVFILGVRRDLAVASTSATGDYSELAVNRFGAAYTSDYKTSTKTYGATSQITPVASPTDIAAIFGQATTTVYVTKIRITAIQTALGQQDVLIIKRSTATTGSTPVNFSVGSLDAGDAAASSTPVSYTTTNPTPGTPVATIRRSYITAPAAASGQQNELVFDFGITGKPVVLSGTAQGLAINLNGTSGAGLVMNVTFEYIEF